MPAGLRFVLSEFSVCTYSKLENPDIENSDLPNVNQKRLKKQSSEQTSGRDVLLKV